MSTEIKDGKAIEDISVNSQNLSGAIKTNPKGLVKNDPVVYRENEKSTAGKITGVTDENGVIKIDITPYGSNAQPIRVKANDPNLDPLFFVNGNKKTFTRFSYGELKDLLAKDKMMGLTWNDLTKANKAYNSLMLGNRTEVIDNIQITREKNITEGKTVKTIQEKFNVSARLELRRRKNGSAYVHGEFKQRELNLDAPFYGREFSPEEKTKLKEKGELGLVEGFINQQTGEVYNLWVGVDKGLNKVISRRENEIKIDKIFGAETTKAQKIALKNGEGQLIKFTKTDKTKASLFVIPSAASTKLDGLRSYTPEKAKEFGLMEEKKNSSAKNKGLRV